MQLRNYPHVIHMLLTTENVRSQNDLKKRGVLRTSHLKLKWHNILKFMNKTNLIKKDNKKIKSN